MAEHPSVEGMKSLRIENFRAFSRLEISDLSQINLFVGKNNTGKTTLLEALQLYHSEDNLLRISELLFSRDEYAFARRRRAVHSIETEPPLSYESLFNGRPSTADEQAFFIGPIDASPKLEVRLTWVRRVEDPAAASIRYEPSLFDDAIDPDVVAGLEIKLGRTRVLVPTDRLNRLSMRRRAARGLESKVAYLGSAGMTSDEIGRVWDTVALTEDEDIAVDALRAIAPSLEKLVLVQSPSSRSDRILMAKLTEFNDPVPFRSLGEGAVHLLGVVLALIRSRGGVLLVDEIENGIHYSVQSEVWRLIFRQAIDWNIQIFATTHSWDCVLGFQEAAGNTGVALGALFRLERSGDSVRAVRFTPPELAIAERESIEIR